MSEKLLHFWGGSPRGKKCMKRQAMKDLAELEGALIDAGVPEDDVYQLVDRFEEEVEELLDEAVEAEDGDEDDDEPSEPRASGKNDAYRPG